MFEMEFKRVILQGGWHYGSKWNWEWLFLSGENTKNSDKSSFLKKMSDHTNEILEKKLAKKKVNIGEIESIEAKESMFGKKVTLSKEDYDKLSDTAKKYVAMEKNIKKLKKSVTLPCRSLVL